MIDVNVGDIVWRKINVTSNKDWTKDERKPQKGRIIYIHPRRKFYTVEFECLYGTIRESYPM